MIWGTTVWILQKVQQNLKSCSLWKCRHPLQQVKGNHCYHSNREMVCQVQAAEQHPWQSGIRPHCAHCLNVYNIIWPKDGVTDPNPQWNKVCESYSEHGGHRVAQRGTEGSSPFHRTLMASHLLTSSPSSLPVLLALVVLPTSPKPLFLLLLLVLMFCHAHSLHLKVLHPLQNARVPSEDPICPLPSEPLWD